MKNIVKTEEGLLFKEITVPEYKLPCDLCSYHGSCDNIRDPKGRDDITFLDYCGEMSDSMIPVEGTIEKVMNVDILKMLVEKDPEVKVSKVIDSICPGVCDFYDKSHCNCNSTNRTCILRNLLT